MAYVRRIGQNTIDSHQTSPAMLVTFTRWANRDTFNYTGNPQNVRQSFAVVNDAITCSTTNTKQGVTPSIQIVLKGGDINYATAVHPGDFVFLNMVHDKDKIQRDLDKSGSSLKARADNAQAINNYNDGFKGLFKVQTCREELITNPQNGTKTLVYRVHAFGFTEFNSRIYYDPQVFNELKGKYRLFAAQFDNFWSNTVSGKNNFSIQELMRLLIKTLIGQGTKKADVKIPTPSARHFLVPKQIGTLLGLRNVKYVSEIYNYLFGVWRPSSNKAASPGIGFNPSVGNDSGVGFYKTSRELDGRRILAPDYWNNVRVWDIINGYLNSTVNEMYTTYRVNIDNKVMPTLIARQKTFSSLHFKIGKKYGRSKSAFTPTRSVVSRHLEMPRWKIEPELVYSTDLGRDEAARINFVQIYSRTLSSNDSKNRAMQAGQGNFASDIGDIERNGLRPYLATANFDFPGATKSETQNKGREWAHLVADWLFNGHLREAGTITCYGIEEPISVGDKLEFNNVVYEIEGVNHSISINKEGFKSFRTTLTVSFGTELRSTTSIPVYPKMDHTDAQLDNRTDYANEAIKPGISDTQDIFGRIQGEEPALVSRFDNSFTTGTGRRFKKRRATKVLNGDGTRKKFISKGRSDGLKGKKKTGRKK